MTVRTAGFAIVLAATMPFFVRCSAATPAQTSGPTPESSPPRAQPSPATLAFAADLTGDHNWEIYTVNADGSELTQLTDDIALDARPIWSPDGSRIAFERWQNGDADLYVVNRDGSGLVRLTDNPGWDISAFWTPDGERIAFLSGRQGQVDIYVMRADGSDVHRITESAEFESFGRGWPLDGSLRSPWSPDGTQIAFTRTGEISGPSIVVVDVDSGDETQLLASSASQFWFFGGWSPGGDQIFVWGGSPERYEIAVMNADGSGLHTLVTLEGENPQGFPAWSPDGTEIAFTAEHDGADAIHVLDIGSSTVAPLTSGGCDGLFGTAWSPDGERIAFTRGCWDGRAEVWVINADGSRETRLAGTGHFSPQPWFPALGPVWANTP